MHDEGPSPADIERFSSSETGYCPACGGDVWDDTPHCPSCGAWLDEGVSLRDPVSHDFQKRFIVLIVVIILIAFFGFSWLF